MIERTPELDHQIAVHEAAHCLIGRIFDMPIAGVTIEPGPDFLAKVWGPGSTHYSKLSDGGQELLVQVQPLMPRIGESRNDLAPLISHAQVRCIELLAGRVAEEMFFPDQPVLGGDNDQRQAMAYARNVVCTDDAVADFISYTRVEAASLLERYHSMVEAVANALIERRTLSGAELDAIIASALAAQDLAAEHTRRDQMRRMYENAEKFKELISS